MANSPVQRSSESRMWVGGANAASFLLFLFLAAIVWQLAFHAGTRQSSDILVESPDTATEVVLARAQLEEMQRSQDQLLAVVLAAFGAGFTVLVLVNIGGLVMAQRNFDRDERAMRVLLREDAQTIINAEAAKNAAELQAMGTQIHEQLSELTTRIGQANGRIDDLYKQSSTIGTTLSDLRFDTLRLKVRDALNRGNRLEALRHLAAVAQAGIAERKHIEAQGAVSQCNRILQKMDSNEWEDIFLDESDFDNLSEAVEEVRMAFPNNKFFQSTATSALQHIERGRQVWRSWIYSQGDPPTTPAS